MSKQHNGNYFEIGNTKLFGVQIEIPKQKSGDVDDPFVGIYYSHFNTSSFLYLFYVRQEFWVKAQRINAKKVKRSQFI